MLGTGVMAGGVLFAIDFVGRAWPSARERRFAIVAIAVLAVEAIALVTHLVVRVAGFAPSVGI